MSAIHVEVEDDRSCVQFMSERYSEVLILIELERKSKLKEINSNFFHVQSQQIEELKPIYKQKSCANVFKEFWYLTLHRKLQQCLKGGSNLLGKVLSICFYKIIV